MLNLHPGKFSFGWLNNQEDNTDYSCMNFKHLNAQDFQKLDLNVDIDSLYLIKWCDLDYDEVTW